MILPILLIISSFTLSGRSSSQELKEETWKLPEKDTLSLETLGSTKVFISGNNSSQIEIKLQYASKPDEKFELKEKENAIYLKEIVLNYDSHRPTKTYFEDWIWTITVPQGTYIKCKGSSSDFEINGFNGSINAHYASTRFNIANVKGNIELSMAQLDARINNSEGSFILNSAGGSIMADDLTITGNSSFRSGTGSIKISLARTPSADLYVGSNFNKAQVSFNDHPVSGYFEMIARAGKGSIICPYKFDNEETFSDDIERYGAASDFGKKGDYYRKSFIRGDSKPKITIKTVTGTAQLIR
jgi:DUF4097 and DUF4098 domain-containing protein YvlB